MKRRITAAITLVALGFCATALAGTANGIAQATARYDLPAQVGPGKIHGLQKMIPATAWTARCNIRLTGLVGFPGCHTR